MAKTNSGLLEFKDAQKVLIALDDATSEVKKAVIIAADGTETDIAGGGSDVTVEALSVTENGTYSEEGKAYSPVTVNVEGSASDFSAAEVTSSADSAENINITAITEIGPNKETVAETSLSSGGTKTAVLYQGHQYVNISPSKTVTVVSGSAEVIEEADSMFGTMHFLDIKGDCTILVALSE